MFLRSGTPDIRVFVDALDGNSPVCGFLLKGVLKGSFQGWYGVGGPFQEPYVVDIRSYSGHLGLYWGMPFLEVRPSTY